MAHTSKHPANTYLRSSQQKNGMAMQIVLVIVVIAFAIGTLGYIIVSHRHKQLPAGDEAIRMVSTNVVTDPDTHQPKVILSLYEDFLCPACGTVERTFGPTFNKIIQSGAAAVDYHMVSILDRQHNNYSSRAGAAAYCVADESHDAFGRFHAMLYSKRLQPAETARTFPDDTRLIEIARQAGAVGSVPECVHSGKYVKMVSGMAEAANIHATPTLLFNGQPYKWSTPEALVEKVKEVVGNLPGLEAITPSTHPTHS